MIYLIKRRRYEEWNPDEALAMVVRAESSKQARILASKLCGDEGASVWLSASESSCTLVTNGRGTVLVRDFWEG